MFWLGKKLDIKSHGLGGQLTLPKFEINSALYPRQKVVIFDRDNNLNEVKNIFFS